MLDFPPAFFLAVEPTAGLATLNPRSPTFLFFQDNDMKSLICFSLAAAALAVATASFAQTTSAPLTRAEVMADLVRVEQAGYQPAAGDDPHYPDDIQAAEARVAAQATAQQRDAVQARR